MSPRQIRKPPKISPEKLPTRKKLRRTGIEDCFHYLGEVGALFFFCRAALDPDADGASLLNWTLRLREALLSQKEKYAGKQDSQAEGSPLKAFVIKAPQISTWRRANPIRWEAPPQDKSETLSLRVLAIEVCQSTATESRPRWEGHLLVIYEPRTETLAHHFLKINRSADVSADWILYVLAGADGVIRRRAADRQLAVSSVHVTLPDPTYLNPDFIAAYAEAGRRLNAAIATGDLSCAWRQSGEVCMTLSAGDVDELGPRSVQVSLTFDSFRPLANAAIRVAEAFSRADPKYSPSWRALNPRKGEVDRRPGWADELHLSRIAASAKHR